jgi:aerotaxis receptor
MRANLPVTTNEFPFPSGQTLVSTTDVKGRILYCNPMFIEVSGYSKEELLGQPHNLIRHPDMPEEAFRDMWATIESGKPWSAPVKNRRKNGDYYWVMANATPLLDDKGEPIGHMSVRVEATRDQIQAAERLYSEMRREKSSGKLTLKLKEGNLKRDTVFGHISEIFKLGLSAKLFASLAAASVTSCILGILILSAEFSRAAIFIFCNTFILCFGWWFLNQLLIDPLGGLVKVTHRMAAGDLTQRISTKLSSELGDLEKGLSQLNVNLLSIVRDAREQSMNMLAGATEIAQGNLDLSQRTESQASNLEETAASMEQITGTVRQTAESAQQASSLSARAREIADKGNKAVTELGETMREIQASSSRIGDITQVIEGIAFQTNILALNAAVEAARAGEQGRGFAVVASEVRSLAQRTTVAAKEIKQLIDDSVAKVEEGHKKTISAQETMSEAVEGVRQVTVLVDEISSATTEQLAGVSQINAAISQLDTITQQNAALVEEMAASAQSLEGIATAVTEAVQVFRLDNVMPQAFSIDAVSLRRSNKQLRFDRNNATPMLTH